MERLEIEQNLQTIDTLFHLYLRYIPEALGIAIVMIIFGRFNKLSIYETLTIIAIISLTLFVLDLTSPQIGKYTRKGLGFGTGFEMIGGKCPNCQEQHGGMDSQDAINYYHYDRIPPNLPRKSEELVKHQEEKTPCPDVEDYFASKIRRDQPSYVKPYDTESTVSD